MGWKPAFATPTSTSGVWWGDGALGMSDSDILADVQGLTGEDLQAAWEYYQAHPDEIDRAIRLNAEA